MVLALLALALLVWGVWLERQGRPHALRPAARRPAGRSSASLSFLCYFNFGLCHFRNYIHQWDTFHYYVGSKYFKELSYDRLYECVAVADSEEPGLRRRVELRKVMNLRTNMLEGTAADPGPPGGLQGALHAASAGRSSRRTSRYFRGKHDVKRWDDAADRSRLQRHAGLEHPRHDAGQHRARQRRTDLLADQDRSALHRRHHAHGVVGVRLADDVRRAGGVRDQLPVTLLLDGRGVPALGLAVLLRGRRSAWCKKDRPMLGGVFLGYSTLLRVFPVFVFTGPVLVALRQLWGTHAPMTALAGASTWLEGRHGRRADERPSWCGPIRIYKPQPFATLRAFIGRIDRGTCGSSSARRWRSRSLMPLSLVTSSGIGGYQRVRLQHAEAQGDAAHQPHGAAHGRDLQPVRGGPRRCRTIASRRSVGRVEDARRSPRSSAGCRSTCCSCAGFVVLLFALAARAPSRGWRARWAR